MKDYARAESWIRSILGLERSPVAVRFVPAGEDLPTGFDAPTSRRYCQILMEACEGKKVLLTPDTIACPASAAALGFKPLPEKLRTGEMLEAYGIFASRGAGKNTIDSMPRFPMGKYRAVAACPLGKTPSWWPVTPWPPPPSTPPSTGWSCWWAERMSPATETKVQA